MTVPEVAEAILRLPRRHPKTKHLLANRLCPGEGLVVGDERHRSDTSLAVAGSAVVPEYREEVLVVVPA